MEKSKVSVILLTLNSDKYISRAILSVINQNYVNTEIIVVDAGSVDNTKNIVFSIDEKIKWFDLPKSDMGMARNYGVSKASGDYIMFLDSDDLYMENKIFSQVTLLEENSELDFVASLGYVMNENKKFFGIKKGTTKPLDLNALLNGSCYCLGSLCIRNNKVKPLALFREGQEGRVCEDWSDQLSLFEKNRKYLLQEEPFIIVELRSDSHTNWSIQPKMKEVGIKILKESFSKIEQGNLYNKKKTILDKNRLKLAISYLINHDKLGAKKALKDISNSNYLYKLILLNLINVIPQKILSWLFIRYWIFRQKMSFRWTKISDKEKLWLDKCNINMRGKFG